MLWKTVQTAVLNSNVVTLPQILCNPVHPFIQPKKTVTPCERPNRTHHQSEHNMTGCAKGGPWYFQGPLIRWSLQLTWHLLNHSCLQIPEALSLLGAKKWGLKNTRTNVVREHAGEFFLGNWQSGAICGVYNKYNYRGASIVISPGCPGRFLSACNDKQIIVWQLQNLCPTLGTSCSCIVSLPR